MSFCVFLSLHRKWHIWIQEASVIQTNTFNMTQIKKIFKWGWSIIFGMVKTNYPSTLSYCIRTCNIPQKSNKCFDVRRRATSQNILTIVQIRCSLMITTMFTWVWNKSCILMSKIKDIEWKKVYVRAILSREKTRTRHLSLCKCTIFLTLMPLKNMWMYVLCIAWIGKGCIQNYNASRKRLCEWRNENRVM